MSFGRSIMSIKSNRNMICCMQLQMHHGSMQQTTTTEKATKRTVFEERAKQLRRFMFVRVSTFRFFFFFFCIDVGWQLPIRSFPFFEQISYILLMRIFRGWFARFPTLRLSFLDAVFFFFAMNMIFKSSQSVKHVIHICSPLECVCVCVNKKVEGKEDEE